MEMSRIKITNGRIILRDSIIHGTLLVEDGKIIERGTHSDLMKNSGLYSELFSRQDLTTN
jgi:ABC-type transport system involved in Fe-S cluster assembly fused permease/ATPase subunit